MRRVAVAMLVVGVVLIGADALGSGVEAKAEKVIETPRVTEAAPDWKVRIDKFKLYQSSGAELYRELCANCHGVEGDGRSLIANPGPVRPPALKYLRSSGIAREHWTYVILSPYEDKHHSGVAGMPCWSRILHQALGNEAGPMLVASKLTDYLEEIQE